MLKFLNKKKFSVVGVDITHAEVKLLEVSSDRGRYCVEGFYRERLPVKTNQDSNFNNNAAVTECIRRARSKGHIQAKRAIVAVPDAAAITTKFSVNAGLTEREIEEFIHRESSQYLPYPKEGMNIDFQILGPSENAISMLDVLVVVSKTLTVNERVQMVREAGLSVIVVDIESYAIERAVRLLKQGNSAEAITVINQPYKKMKIFTGLINLSLFSIQLFVFQGSEVIFTREEISSSQASADSALLVIKRLMQFFFSTSQALTIDEFIIAGEYATLANLQTMLEELTGVSVLIADPLNALPVHSNVSEELLHANTSSLMLACGLALRGLPCV